MSDIQLLLIRCKSQPHLVSLLDNERGGVVGVLHPDRESFGSRLVHDNLYNIGVNML